MPAITDFIQKTTGAAGGTIMQPLAGVFVRLLNNQTGVATVSLVATDAGGTFAMPTMAPGQYTVYTGPSATGPWTVTTDNNYQVAPTLLRWANPMDYGALCNGIADDSTAWQNAINDVRDGKAAAVWHPGGTSLAAGLIWYSGVHLFGPAGSAVLMLKPNAGTFLIQSTGWALLVGTDNQGGISNWGFHNVIFDGNFANNAAGPDLMQLYGYGFTWEHVRFRNCYAGAFSSEWSSFAGEVLPDGTPARFIDVQVHRCNQGNLANGYAALWNGPHDSLWTDSDIYINGFNPGTGNVGLWIRPNGVATQFLNVHVWGAHHTVGIRDEGGCIFFDCESEDAPTSQLQCFTDNTQWYSGQLYYAPVGAVGVTLGQVIANPTIAPVPTAAAGTTGLAAGVYTLGFTYKVGTGETQIGPTANVTLTAGQKINVAALAGLPAGVIQVRVYFTAVPGGMTAGFIQAQNVGPGATTLAGFSITTQGSGAAAPGANTAGKVNNTFLVTRFFNNATNLNFVNENNTKVICLSSGETNMYAGTPSPSSSIQNGNRMITNGSTATWIIQDDGANGACILLTSASGGTLTPGKYLRSQNGNLQVLNNAFGAILITLDDFGNLYAGGSFSRKQQAIAYAAAITPNLNNGDVVTVGALTGAITVNAPIMNALVAGTMVTFGFTQDGTGGRQVTWNAVFKTAWQPASAPSATSSVTFVYDGANWQQVAGGIAVDQNGQVYLAGNVVNKAQGIAFAGTITPNAAAGEIVIVGALTANMIVASPTNPAVGQRLTFLFQQDGTGGRTLTWSGGFRAGFWQPAPAANAVSSVTFEYSSSTFWEMVQPSSVDQNGNQAIAGTLTTKKDRRISKQAVAFAASITPDPTAGEIVMVGLLTANITVANVAAPQDGQQLTLHFQEDAVGGRTIGFGTAYKVNWAPGTGANLRNVISFYYDTASGFWIQKSSAVGLPA